MKTYVGIEVPNKKREKVFLGDILHRSVWQSCRATLPLVLGVDVQGEDVIMDLAKAPHLLVAGATGSGKSVCLNCFILSLLMRYSPDELRMILVDPKVVEMNIYGRLPHLIVPVITDPKLVGLALRWLVREMERRYQLLKVAGVREIGDFNRRKRPPEPLLDDEGNPLPDKLPYIVLVVDELADLMLQVREEVENGLAALSQKSRAIGIHMIVATQRPDVKVVTGNVKANLPMRISFKTTSYVDSKTILDGKGAEALLGYGDMLYKTPKFKELQRIQGAMMQDEEIEKIVQFCSEQSVDRPDSFDLIQPAVSETEETGQGECAEDGKVSKEASRKHQLHQVVSLIYRDRNASISYVQRRLGIGYNHAANLVEELADRGVLGPPVKGGRREILPESEDEALSLLEE